MIHNYDELLYLKKLIDNYEGSMLVTDDKGKFIYVNQGCTKLLDISQEELLNITIYDTLDNYCYASGASTIKTLETKQPCLSAHTIGKDKNKTILALSKPIFNKFNALENVVTYSWDERDLYDLLSMFDKEKKNLRDILQFINNTNKLNTNFIAESQIMKNLISYINKIAFVDSTIILYGESGSGKEVFSKYIHNCSKRSEKVFIPINCAAIPKNLLESEMFGYEKGTFTGGDKDGKKGIFEFANEGTIFLDEIGELPLDLQAKLLRIIETGEVKRLGGNKIINTDVRVIAATNRDLMRMVKEGTFRSDLYYRLNVIPITLPPLRERIDDIEPLAVYFLEKFNKKFACSKILSPQLIEKLKSYKWPGNVRELKNIIERIVITSNDDIISPNEFMYYSDIHSQNNISINKINIDTSKPLNIAIMEYEKQYILSVIESCNGDLHLASKRLNIHISSIYRKLKNFK